MITVADRVELTVQQLDAVAWRFLGSKFTSEIYADWPIDRRVEAYLTHDRLVHLANDGAACDEVLQRVMANIGRAFRDGVLTRRKPPAP